MDHYCVVADKNEFCDDIPKCQTMEKDLMHEAIAMFDEDYERLSAAKEGKPYYVLPKEELLKYTDEYYIPKPDQYSAMSEFLKAHVSEDSRNILSITLAPLGYRYALNCSVDMKNLVFEINVAPPKSA